MTNLNSSQEQAVVHESGPLLIVAGAGTGKTTVLTEWIKYLIQKKQVNPHRIFATTFTDKASEEMLSRLDVVMPLGYQEPWIGTFHSLCDRILRQEGLEIGVNSNFTLMTQTDQWLFIREHLFDFQLSYYRPLGNPARFIGAMIKFFSRLTDEDIAAADAIALANKKAGTASTEDEVAEAARQLELAKAYDKYQQLKHELGKLDFGDLITLTLRLLRERPNIRKQFRFQFEHMMVDEFQDTNYAQFELIKLLAPPDTSPNLVVVGDDDQAIFRFRGASVANILMFKDTYPNAREVVLTKNYRSSQSILDSSYRSVIFNNPDRLEVKLGIDKKLVASLPAASTEPAVYRFATLDEEVEWTIQQIYDLVTKHGLTYKDIAIITRANSHLDPYLIALKNAAIPYQLVTNRGLYDQEEIKGLINILKVLANPNDSIALFQLLLTPVYAYQSSELLDLMQKAHQTSTSLWWQLEHSSLEKHADTIKLLDVFRAQAADKRVSELLYSIMEQLKYIKNFTLTESLENQLKIKNINLFFSQLKRFEATSTDKSLIGYLNTYELWEEAGENPGQAQIEDIDTVSLMTVHKAKGLEFSAVFVGGLVAGRFPSNNRSDPITVPDELVKEPLPEGDEHLQEERRLFYVAITRAKHFLYLTYAEDLGGARKRKMSGFCAETGLPVITPEITPVVTNHILKPAQAQVIESGQYKIDKVSYSQIHTFDTCPQKFKYRYLLQIPTMPHHSLSFGQTIHQTLYEFHTALIQGKPFSLPQLEDLYTRSFIDVGYEGPEHKAERFTAGLAALKHYYERHQLDLGKPVLLEQPFSIKLNNANLTGKIDRIDLLDNGVYEIVDYKTGELKKQKDVDKDDQLTIYALAAQKVFNLPVTQASLYFIEKNGTKLTTLRSPDDIEKAKARLEKKIAAIKASDFPAKPDPVKCGFCEFYHICPWAAKKRPI